MDSSNKTSINYSSVRGSIRRSGHNPESAPANTDAGDFRTTCSSAAMELAIRRRLGGGKSLSSGSSSLLSGMTSVASGSLTGLLGKLSVSGPMIVLLADGTVVSDIIAHESVVGDQ